MKQSKESCCKAEFDKKSVKDACCDNKKQDKGHCAPKKDACCDSKAKSCKCG